MLSPAPGAEWVGSISPACFDDLQRGHLRPGAPADIVVHDLESLPVVPEHGLEVLRDYPANEWWRVHKAEGCRWVPVNGEVAFQDGQAGATLGRLLRNRRLAPLPWASSLVERIGAALSVSGRLRMSRRRYLRFGMFPCP